MGSLLSGLFASGPGAGHPSFVTINGTGYKLTKLLGEGGYAFVYLATVQPKPGTARRKEETVAVKRFLLKDTRGGVALELDSPGAATDQAVDDEKLVTNRILREVELHKSLCPHPNIVSYIDHQLMVDPASYCQGTGSGGGGKCPEVWVVMELMGDSLQTTLNRAIQEQRHLDLRGEVLPILSDVVTAVAHMHRQSPAVSHWDLKLDNVLVAANSGAPFTNATSGMANDNAQYKLCDFGSATQMFYHPQTSKDINTAETELDEMMTLLYRSPESLDLWEKRRVDTKSDVWSLGVMLYVLLFNKMPFEATRQAVIQSRVVIPPPPLGTETLPVPSEKAAAEEDVDTTTTTATATSSRDEHHTPTTDLELAIDLRVLLGKLLTRDPDERPSIFEVSAMLSEIYPRHLATPPPQQQDLLPQRPRFRS